MIRLIDSEVYHYLFLLVYNNNKIACLVSPYILFSCTIISHICAQYMKCPRWHVSVLTYSIFWQHHKNATMRMEQTENGSSNVFAWDVKKRGTSNLPEKRWGWWQNKIFTQNRKEHRCCQMSWVISLCSCSAYLKINVHILAGYLDIFWLSLILI